MPSPIKYKKLLGSKTNGEIRKIQSDEIMNATWYEDISSRIAYLCDWYHDSERLILNDLHPEDDPNKIPIEIKFLQSASQTYDKDQVTFHLQLRPNQLCNVPYYETDFKIRYDAMFPVGLYAIIQDEKGVWNRWLIVDRANVNATQFPTFEILRCDYVFQYIMEHKKIQIPGVLRSQNSYNSGLWTDYKITSPEDQQKFALPLNRDTEKIWDNLRMIVDNKVLSEPRCWEVSKINRISPNGIVRVTLAQDIFDQHKDYIELDKEGNVIGMWADYFTTAIPPAEQEQDQPIQTIYGNILYSSKPVVKVGGSYKKFSIIFYNEGELIDFIPGTWNFTIDGIDASDLVDTILDNNQLKIKFNGNDSWIGKIMTIKYVTDIDKIETNVDVEIVGL